MSVALAEPAAVGHNGPPADAPAPNPFDAIVIHLTDLLTEAANWADGTKVESQAQADTVGRLIGDLREGMDAAEALRVEEKSPLDERIREIQDRFNVWLAPLKNKVPGKVPTAISALEATVKPFLDAERKRLQDISDAAAKDAADKAAAAAQAIRDADASDLAGREAAEALVTQAHQAGRVAATAAADRPRMHGGSRARGLTATYTARLDDPRAALLHYWGGKDGPGAGRDALVACLQDLAQADVSRKIHTIPGVFVVEGTRL
jgi:hypothetical protein